MLSCLKTLLVGALVLRTKGKPSSELGHTNQATYFIARDRKTWSLSCTGVKMGKMIFNLTGLNQT